VPDLGQKDSNVIRYEDQEVRRSNTELTDEGNTKSSAAAIWLHWLVFLVELA
jgi:hypothetical protein